jgi:hypothetical protein
MLGSLTVDSFVPHVGSPFQIELSPGQMMIVELSDAQLIGPSSARSPFRLLFRGPRHPILPQRIYRLQHAVMGPLDLFFVPLGPEGGRMRYEAIFA